MSYRLMPQTLFQDVWPTRRDPDTGVKICRVCNNPVQPPKHHYCGDDCSELALKAVNWDYARRLTLRRDQGCCKFPGCTRAITWRARNTDNTAHIHHVYPVAKIHNLCWDLIREWGIPPKSEIGDDRRTRVFSRLYTILFCDVNNLISYCTEHHKLVHAADMRNKYWTPQYHVARTFWANFWGMAHRDFYTRTLDHFFK